MKSPLKRRKLFRFVTKEKKLIKGLPLNNEFKHKLVLVKTDDIGDYLLWRQVLPIIRERFSHKIILVGNQVWKELFEWLDGGLVEETIWIDKRKWDQPDYRLDCYKLMRQLAPEIAVNCLFTRNYKIDDLLIYASNASQKIAWDTKNQREQLNPKLISEFSTLSIFTNIKLQHEFYRNNEFVEKWLKTDVNFKKPQIQIGKIINRNPNLILLFPGANANSRKWAKENVIQVGKYLTDNNYEIQLLGGPSDMGLCKEIEIGINSNLVKNVCGTTTLPDLVNNIAAGSLLITNDTGAMHIAVSVDTPAICISNGFHYTRFTDYSNFEGTKTRTFVPPSFQRKFIEKGILAEKEYYTSKEINEVLPGKIIENLKTCWWAELS